MQPYGFGLDRDELCERFGGGLPRGSLVIVEGEYGAGKSILSQRLSYGLVQNGHSVTYVSTELTTAGFLDQMESLKYDVEKAVVEERLVFIPVYPLLGARAPRHDLLRRVVRTQKMYTKDVILFDSFSKFLADHERMSGSSAAAMEQIEEALYLFKRLNSLGKTIVVNFESGQVRDEVASLFKESADMFLSLKFELLGNVAARRIVVNRLSRAQGRFGDVIGYRVEPGVGIVIEIKSVV
ncbi:MAG TPA: ATPase domain-containing protein [Candidatus Thermoplasmatota archaeon]|nr:ATPase domain-containing protein [Candidatus Thermoplasmatota archaeon]